MEKMEEWTLEMPFIFTEYIRSNKLRTYRDPKVEGDISKYLDEILNKFAIPRMKKAFEGDDKELIESTLDILEELAETNSAAVRPIQSLLEELAKNSNKTTQTKIQRIIKNL